MHRGLCSKFVFLSSGVVPSSADGDVKTPLPSESSSNFVDEQDDSSGIVLSNVTCHLESTELWAKFHDLGTEMIITKTGRYSEITSNYRESE